MSARRKRRGELREGATLVDGMFARLGLAAQARAYRAMGAWHEVAGPRLRQRVRAERVHHGVLQLRVASAAWANELSYMRRELLDRLHELPGGEIVDELRFSVGPVDELPSWDDPPPPPPPPPRARPSLDDGPIVAALSQVKDPELREALAELFARERSRA